jgi:hypothetical protein
VKLKAAELAGEKPLEERVEEMMARENLRVEVRVGDKWAVLQD